jgi:hypothetical protein
MLDLLFILAAPQMPNVARLREDAASSLMHCSRLAQALCFLAQRLVSLEATCRSELLLVCRVPLALIPQQKMRFLVILAHKDIMLLR